MTLDTRLVTTTVSDGREIFHELRRLLGAGENVPIQDGPVSDAYYGEDVWKIAHPPDQGLSAWLMVYYRPDLEPRRRPDEACEEDGWQHPACWVEVSLDTAYGYHGPEGDCGGLHARLLFDLGQWLDEREIGWGWQNEFTGEWHYEDRYRALTELCSYSGQAMAWFTEIVQPSIESLLR